MDLLKKEDVKDISYHYGIKCEDCRLTCMLKQASIKNDIESRCTVPQARQHAALYGHAVVDSNILFSLASNTLVAINNRSRTLKDLERLFDLTIKFRESFFPSVQSSINISASTENTNIARQIIEEIVKQNQR